MTTKGKLNPKEVKDDKFEKKAQLNAVEEKVYQTMEVSSLLTQITQQNLRIDELKTQLAKAIEEKQEDKEIHLKTTRKWEKDLETKSNDYENLKKELASTQKEYEEKIVKLTADKNDEIKNLKSEINHVKFELNKRITELNEENRNIQEFKEKQDEYYLQLENLKKRSDELIHQHNDNLKKIDSTNSKAIQMQQDRHDKEVNQIIHDAQKEAEKQVGELERKVMEDNKKLNADLEEYRKEVDALKKEKEKAVGSSRQIKLNVSLQEDEIVEYQALHSRQQSKIKKLKEKVQVLKNYIIQEVGKHTKELEMTKYQAQTTMNELETQIQNLQDELKNKIKEGKNLKALSQIILDQRSETEEFLMETLDYVKEEVRKQRVSDKRMKLPEIWSHPKLESKSRRNWEKIDFTSLDWEDKEKILQILFSKMNSGNLPTNWRNSTFDKSSESINKSNLNSAKIHKSTFSQSAHKLY